MVDDHPAILASVAAAVEDAAELTLVGTARTVAEALDLAGAVDVLVCDVQLAGRAEGLRILESIHDPRASTGVTPPSVILLSGFEQPSLLRAAVDRGAAGYLTKSAEMAEIVAAIRTVATGGTVFTAAALQSVRTARRRPSGRELEVIEGIRSGSTNGEVAAALGLSEKTIESHLRRLFDRYGLMSRTELVVLAIEEGWTIDPMGDR